MIFRIFLYLVIFLSLTSCSITGIKPNYVEPIGKNISYLSVSTITGDVNRRFYIHGENQCRLNDSKLVGLLNSRTIGLKSISGKVITVQANAPLIVSSPTAIVVSKNKALACQPIIEFTPETEKTYFLEFSGCKVNTLKDEVGSLVSYEIIESCDLSNYNQSATNVFFLKDPT
jgi:hypothetical protein